MLKLNNIHVTLSNTASMTTKVLQNLNLYVANGEFVIIIGNNGCGKSTMLNTIAGHVRPETGELLIAGKNITKQSATQRAALIAHVMQEPGMGTIANMTIEENLNLAYMRGQRRSLRLHNTSKRRVLFQEYLKMLDMDLEQRFDQLVGTLSGGQRQALSLIMAIIADYKILLLDEITAALDPRTADNVIAIAAKLVKEQKRTAILITHNMQYALNYGDRTLLMTSGNQFIEYDSQAKQKLSPADLAAAISTA